MLCHQSWGHGFAGRVGCGAGLAQFDADGAVVAAVDVVEDEGVLESGSEFWGDEDVVNAPADVAFACAGQKAPPGVVAGAFFEFAEGVDESGAQVGVEAGAFLGCEAVVVAVGGGVGEVQFGVGDVEVAAEDDGFGAAELEEVAEEGAVPLLAVRQAGEVASGVGDVNVDEEEVVELGGEDAAFGVVSGGVEACGDAAWSDLGEECGAGVAFALGGVPPGGVVGGPELFDAVRVAAGFLEAEQVGAFGVEELEEIFLEEGAQAVDVPGDDFHGGSVGDGAWLATGRGA